MQPDRHIDKPNRDAPTPEWPSCTTLVWRFIRRGVGDDQGFGLILFFGLLFGNTRRNDLFFARNSRGFSSALALW